MYSSSESEDDCYGDVARKLEKLKNKYRDDKFESVDLLDESGELIEQTCNLDRDFEEQITGYAAEISKSTDMYKTVVERDESLYRDTKRITRSLAKKAGEDVAESVCGARAATRGRGRNRRSTNKTSSHRGRGRDRGRGRGAEPVYIDDADEYPDRSQNLGLFSKTSDDVVLVEDNDIFEQNEELSVKVCWRSAEYCSFKVRKHQKLSLIFRHFAEEGNVSEDRLLFIYNDKILKPDDTPDSIKYNIAKFIQGGVVSYDVTNLHNSDQHGQSAGIKIKFQSHNSKKPFEITIQPDENLSMAMIKCAEQLEQPLNKLKFLFDGYVISGMMTPNQLELEGGECIDVKLL